MTHFVKDLKKEIHERIEETEVRAKKLSANLFADDYINERKCQFLIAHYFSLLDWIDNYGDGE